jgi:hypothetical protein
MLAYAFFSSYGSKDQDTYISSDMRLLRSLRISLHNLVILINSHLNYIMLILVINNVFIFILLGTVIFIHSTYVCSVLFAIHVLYLLMFLGELRPVI